MKPKRHRTGILSGKTKAREKSLHLQVDVGRELEKLIKSGILETTKDVDRSCFATSIIITVKSDKLVKIALDSRKLNDRCMKMRHHMSNMEELLYPILVEITRNRTVHLIIAKIDLDYVYRQMKLSKETSRQSLLAFTGRKFSGDYRFKSNFTDLLTYLLYFKTNDQTLGYCAPAWLDDIIVGTRENKQNHEKKLFDLLNKMEKAGYRANKKESEVFKNRLKWLGQKSMKSESNRTKKTGSINEIKATGKHERTKIVPRSDTILNKVLIENLRTNVLAEKTIEKN